MTIGLTCLLAGCGGHSSNHSVTGPRAGLANAELDVQSGATSITVESLPLGSDLYRVSTPPDAGDSPSVQLDHGRLRVALTGAGGGPSSLKIDVSDAVVWRLRFDGGATDLAVEFRNGKLGSVDLVAGDAHAMLTLPHPSNTVRVAERGGLSSLVVRVAGRAPVRLTLSAGAARVRIDGVTHTGIAGGTVFTPRGWNTARDRYDLLATGGVSSATVGRL